MRPGPATRSGSHTSSCATRPTPVSPSGRAPSSTNASRTGSSSRPRAAPGSKRRFWGSTSSRPPPSAASSATRSDADRIGAQASAHLASAGRRALAAGDLPAASNLLGRAADNLPAGDPQRLAIRLQSIPALFETGRLTEADAQVAEILDVATSPELLAAGRAWRGYFDSQDGIAACEETAAAWLEVSERAGDHAGQAAALGILAKMKFWSGAAAAADAIWQRAADQAALAGDVREEAETLVWLLISTMYGPTPVVAALERCDAIAGRLGSSRKVGAVAAIERGVLEAMQGDCAGGRERVALGRSRLDELGLTMLANVMAQEAAIVEQMAGDAQAAEAVLRPSFERFELMGEAGFKMTIAAMLARSLFEQERVEDGRQFAEIAVRGLHDTDPTGLGSAVEALAAAYDGDTAAAVVLAEEAVALSSASDFLRDHGDRLLDLARVLQLAGRHHEARAALAQADVFYERKGCIAALQTTAARRAELLALIQSSGSTTARVSADVTTGTISNSARPCQCRIHSWISAASSHSMTWKQRWKLGSTQLST